MWLLNYLNTSIWYLNRIWILLRLWFFFPLIEAYIKNSDFSPSVGREKTNPSRGGFCSSGTVLWPAVFPQDLQPPEISLALQKLSVLCWQGIEAFAENGKGCSGAVAEKAPGKAILHLSEQKVKAPCFI